jgi:hypothetical protein
MAAAASPSGHQIEEDYSHGPARNSMKQYLTEIAAQDESDSTSFE